MKKIKDSITESEFTEKRNYYIDACAGGNCPSIQTWELLRSIGGSAADNDVDFIWLRADILTKHYTRLMPFNKAAELRFEIIDKCQGKPLTDYARLSEKLFCGYADECRRADGKKKAGKLVGVTLGVVLPALAAFGFWYGDKQGWWYGTDTLTFVADGATISQDVISFNTNAHVNIPVKAGYDAAGIIDKKTGELLFDSTGLALNKTVNRDLSDYKDRELEVVYSPHVYTAAVKSSAGAPLASFTYTINDDPEELLDEPQELAGYVFDGWFTDVKYKKPFSGNFLDYIDEPLTLYPHYVTSGWTISWALGGGEWLVDHVDSYDILTNIELPTGELVRRAGYTLDGWSLDGRRIQYFSPTVMRDVTLSAIWKPMAYSVRYELDGGETDGAQPDYTIETGITLDKPVRAGYEFAGWYENKALTGVAVTGFAPGTMGDKSVYAKWLPVEYTVSYELDGGENSAYNPAAYTAESAAALYAPTKAGYVFDGWYEVKTDTPRTKLNAPEDKDITLRARWRAAEYTISYSFNGGAAENAPATYTAEDNITLPVPTRGGYDFLGWYTDHTLTGEPVSAIPLGSTGARRFYAAWAAREHYISYETAGGTNSTLNPDTYTVARQVALRDPIRPGYEFLGWFTADTNTKKTVLDAQVDGDVTLEAKWQPKNYTVTVCLNNGNDQIKVTAPYDSGYSLPVPEKRGYTFNGFRDSAGNAFAAEGIYSYTTDKTVIADYAANSYTVYYHAGDGSLLGSATQTVVFDAPYMLAEVSAGSGYEFVGWYDSTSASATRAESGGAYNVAGNLNLYARYVKVYRIGVQQGTFHIDPSVDKLYVEGNYIAGGAVVNGMNIVIDKRYTDLDLILINAGFKAPADTSAIRAVNDGFTLRLETRGDACYICGGDGSASTDPAIKSGSGKSAIEVPRLHMTGSAKSFRLAGGNGAAGARGKDGAKEATALVWTNYGHDGGTGGMGGDSGSAITVMSCTDLAGAELIKGSAGQGGAGGKAGYRSGWVFGKTWGSDGAKGADGKVLAAVTYLSEWE